MKRKEILEAAIRLVTKIRQEQNGDAHKNFSNTAALWNAFLGKEIFTANMVPAMMLLFKLARTKTGEYNSDDYIDLCGYASLMGELEE